MLVTTMNPNYVSTNVSRSATNPQMKLSLSVLPRKTESFDYKHHISPKRLQTDIIKKKVLSVLAHMNVWYNGEGTPLYKGGWGIESQPTP
jgi:hypothetical protein